MKKKLVILGSTGSIGKSLLTIIDKDKSSFDIVLLSAKKDYKTLVNLNFQSYIGNIFTANTGQSSSQAKQSIQSSSLAGAAFSVDAACPS